MQYKTIRLNGIILLPKQRTKMKKPLDLRLNITLPILIVVVVSVVLTIWLQSQNKPNTNPNLNPTNSEESTNENEDITMNTIYLSVNGHHLKIDPDYNPSTEALIERLKTGNITISAEDYGGFEKVGELGFSLPTNDEEVDTMPGEIVLYQGDKLALHYGSNSWSYTRIGHIDITQDDLRTILGTGDVEITLSIE